MPTTTIEITETQKDVLDEIKDHEKEPYKQVLGRLLEVYDDAHHDPMSGYGGDVPPGIVEVMDATDEQLEEIKTRIDELQSTVPERTADELEGRLR